MTTPSSGPPATPRRALYWRRWATRSCSPTTATPPTSSSRRPSTRPSSASCAPPDGSNEAPNPYGQSLRRRMRESSPQGMAWRGLRLRTSPSSGLGWHGTVARGGHEPRIESISWLVRRAVGPVLGQVPTPRSSSRIVATSGPWTCSGSATANTSVAWAVTSRIGVGAKLAKDRIPPRDHHDQRKGVSCLSRLRIT